MAQPKPVTPDTVAAPVSLVAVGALFFCLVLACGRSERVASDLASAAVVRSVDSATNAFAQAQRARDADGAIAHLAPEFFMYNDGNRVDYNAVVSQIRQTFPTLSRLETTWSNLEVHPLGSNNALVTFRFSDQITDVSGNTFGFVGPTTLVWERRGAEWLIIYADADHYPPPP